ncbi:Predicted metal-dependent peptidase [Lachnospiraceae bacterium XBB2008]|nr:Predicted metal-dependent peptidase [Lachnospiraceae bacterium XBB2008]
MDKALADHISEFRSELMKNMPFFGDIMSHVDVVENNSVETACTNGRVIYYNSSFMHRLSVWQQNYIMMHELMHIILLHFSIKIGMDEHLWNVASDYVVNGLLEEGLGIKEGPSKRYNIGFDKPDFGCFLSSYTGQAVEQLYHALYQDNKNNRRSPYVLLIRDGYGLPVKLKPVKRKMDPGGYDIIFDLTPAEAELLKNEIKKLVDDATKSWSDDPSIQIVAEELNILKHADRLPWKKLLKRFLMEAEAEDTSYDHPERKYLHMELILPGAGTESVRSNLENIWAFVDSSGSISQDELNRFVSELYDICRQFDSNVNIGFWDTSVHDVYTNVAKDDIARCNVNYRGGTDANSVYDYLEKNRIDPKVMLILTDGWFERVSDFRAKQYKRKTIVVLSAPTDRNVSNLGKVARLN